MRLPKLKAGERLSVSDLRKFTRLEKFRVVTTRGRHVVLHCEKHGEWEAQHHSVLARSVSCPKCTRTGEPNAWTFSAEDWKFVLRVLQPRVRYIDKAESVGGRFRYRHRCRLCRAVFRNSPVALRQREFKCPECAFEGWKPGPRSRARTLELRSWLKESRYAYARYRKQVVHLQEVQASYAVLKELGVVQYPLQVDAPELRLWKDWEPRCSDLFPAKGVPEKAPVKTKERPPAKDPEVEEEYKAPEPAEALSSYLAEIGAGTDPDPDPDSDLGTGTADEPDTEIISFVEEQPPTTLQVEAVDATGRVILEDDPEPEGYFYDVPKPSMGVFVGRSGTGRTLGRGSDSAEFMAIAREVNRMSGVYDADNTSTTSD